MQLAVSDVVEVALQGDRSAPKRSVLGVVVAANSGGASGTVRVMIGATGRGPQLLDTAHVRRVARGTTVPWTDTDTHKMIAAAQLSQRSAVRPDSHTGGTGAPPAVAFTGTPAQRSTAAPAAMQSDGEHARPSALSSSSSNECVERGDTAAPSQFEVHSQTVDTTALPGSGSDADATNALQTVCAATDAALCGPDLRVCAAAFALLTVWVMLCSVHPVTLAVAIAKLLVALVGFLLCVTAQPDTEEANSNRGGSSGSGALVRLTLVVGVMAVADRGVAVAGVPFFFLLVSCARAFESKERGV